MNGGNIRLRMTLKINVGCLSLGLFCRLVDMSLKIQIQYFSELFIIFSPSYMIVSGTKNKSLFSYVYFGKKWSKVVSSILYQNTRKIVKNEIWLITILLLQHHTTLFISEF